jgi:hypothetical protein
LSDIDDVGESVADEHERAAIGWREGLAQIFAGAGMGLLLGLVVGLSASPVVKTILATLAALLGAFLGLQGGGASEGEGTTKRGPAGGAALRAGAFGLCCALGIVAGVGLRANGSLGPTVGARVAELKAAGYPEREALDLVRRTLIEDAPAPADAAAPGAEAATPAEGAEATAPQASANRRAYLVSAEGVAACKALGKVDPQAPDALLAALRDSGRPEFGALAEALAAIPDPAVRDTAVRRAGGALCDVCDCRP